MTSLLYSELLEQPASSGGCWMQKHSRVARDRRQPGEADIQYVVMAAGARPTTRRVTRSTFFGRAEPAHRRAGDAFALQYLHRPPRLDGALVNRLSQSGQSPDIGQVRKKPAGRARRPWP